MTPNILQRVRLTPAERLAQPEIGETVGVVHEVGEASARVSWPDETAWVRNDYLEAAP